MSWILRLAWYFIGHYVQGQVILRAKRAGVIAYLRALQGTRRILILAILGFFIFHMIVLAGFGALVSGLFLLDYEPKTVLQILFGICLSLFVIPLLLIAIALSERVWYKFSGAEKMVEDLSTLKSE